MDERMENFTRLVPHSFERTTTITTIINSSSKKGAC
jgi:hypothetical protein